MSPQVSGLINTKMIRKLIVLTAALVCSGCVTSGAEKTDEKDVWAAYSVDEILEAGNGAFDSGQYERAVFIYMQALEIEQSAETLYRIAIGKDRLGDKAYAYQALKKAIELDPNHAPSQQELGLIYMAMGQPEQAELHLAKATELDPSLWRAWSARGVIADIDQRYAEAVRLYQSGLLGHPNSAALMNNIGYSYYLSGDLEEATRWFGRAILTSPDYKPAVKNLGLLYARQGWYDEAVETFSKVVDEPQAYNDTGYIAMRNGDYWKASELLAEAIRLSPTYYEKAYENLEDVKAAIKDAGNESAAMDSDTGELSNISEVIFPDGKGTQTRSVMPRALNVRAGPSSDSKIVNYLRTGNEVEVIMTLPGWAFVNYRPGKRGSNLTGWVNINYLSGVEDPVTATASSPASRQISSKPAAEVADSQTSAVASEATNSSTTVESANAGAATASARTDSDPEAPDAESVIRALDAVCGLGDQTEKTPLTAGSCIGVASADADE